MGQASKMNDLCNFMNANRVNVRNEFCLYNFYCIPKLNGWTGYSQSETQKMSKYKNLLASNGFD